MNRIPILYNAIVRAADGHEGHVDLEESAWLDRADVKNAMAFTLQPKHVDCGCALILHDEPFCPSCGHTNADHYDRATSNGAPCHANVNSLPVVCVELLPFPDGTPRRLVYFSRMHGRVITNPASNQPSTAADQTNLFRMYCIGWQATFNTSAEDGAKKLVNVRAVNWIYPGGGSIVMTENPPLVDMLIEHYATEHLYETGAIERPTAVNS